MVQEAFHTTGAPAPHRGHLHDLSVNQLHPIIFAQDASLGHPVVLGHSEQPLKQLQAIPILLPAPL